jgi:hypothetical protein
VDLDPSSLFASVVISGVGFALFVYGRKQMRTPQLVAGLVLMVFPYAVSGAGWMVLVATIILGLLWMALRAGW